MNCEYCGKREAARGGLCWACVSARQRNGTLVRKKPVCGTRYETPEDMLQEAVIGLAEKPGDGNAYRRYLMASLRYRRRRNAAHKPPESSH